MVNKINIAIDGPAGSGKSTTSKLLANKLGYKYLDTGATYRAATFLWLNNNSPTIEEFEPIFKRAKLGIKFDDQKQLIFLDDINISNEIRNQEVTKNVSFISAISYVRDKLVFVQREFASSKEVIVDGRDIGTVVLPDAELKIFLIASIEERANRRVVELQKMGHNVNFEQIKLEIQNRDNYDSQREISPLKKAKDAIEIDTTGLTIGDQVNNIYHLAIQKING